MRLVRITRNLSIVLSLAVLWSAGASAQLNLQMSGEWYGNRGTYIDIPVNGILTTCNAFGFSPGTALCPNISAAGTVVGLVPLTPVVPTGRGVFATANATVRVPTGASHNVGQPFTVKAFAFDQVPNTTANGGPIPAPVPFNATVQQLDTGFDVNAPSPTRMDPSRTGCNLSITANGGNLCQIPPLNIPPPGTVGITRQFFASHATNAPSRAAAPATFTVTKLTGQVIGRLNYVPGPNKFGGLMAMGLDTVVLGIGGATWAVNIPALAGNFPNHIVRVPVTGQGTQHPGRGFSDADLNIRAGASARAISPVFATLPNGSIVPLPNMSAPRQIAFGNTAMTATGSNVSACSRTPMNLPVLPVTPTGCELVVNPGTQLFPFPTSNTFNYGFPWTTGTVVVQEIGSSPAFGPQSELISAMGKDTFMTVVNTTANGAKTAMGTRVIQMVAGGVSRRLSSTGDITEALDAVQMTIVPEPGSTGLLAGALGVIGLLAGMRRRWF